LNPQFLAPKKFQFHVFSIFSFTAEFMQNSGIHAIAQGREEAEKS